MWFVHQELPYYWFRNTVQDSVITQVYVPSYQSVAYLFIKAGTTLDSDSHSLDESVNVT